MSTTGKASRLFHFNLFLFTLSQVQLSTESDSIIPGQTLLGNITLTSKAGIFELGFFAPSNSQNHYIGIWYKGLQTPEKTVVWVANRDLPISDPYHSSLEFRQDGNLVLKNPFGLTVWSTNMVFLGLLASPNSTVVGVLGDDGNFLIRGTPISPNSSEILWQSFDHPTDTWLPGAKLQYNKHGHIKTTMTSWKDQNNPAPGIFSAEVNATEHYSLNLLLLRNRSENYNMFDPHDLQSVYTTIEENNTYYIMYFAVPNSSLVRYVLDVAGQLKLFVWCKGFQTWKSQSIFGPPSTCDCGIYSICNIEKLRPSCQCITGFVPNNQTDRYTQMYSYGCVRRTVLQCINATSDIFIVIPNISYPESSEFLAVKNSDECQLACLSNCSCSAYAYFSKCFIWNGPFQLIRQFSSNEGIRGEFYVRVASSEIAKVDANEREETGHKRATKIIVGAVAVLVFLLGIAFMLNFMRRKVSCSYIDTMSNTLMHFNHRDLKKATKNFREKLGEGGFGSVYKGEFPNITFIAVKEIKCLMQGEKQLRAEVNTIGVIRHRNLVRLLGFSTKDSERFLVYEYMPNGSLESHLFRKGSHILDWGTRYNIALGTAKGLAYLHKECRDCIIHCDIKPENIWLDVEWNPKVADFGLAKLLSRNFSQVLTTIRGTRGYLAPEWFSGEAITAKVDVYSYGQVLFEIIAGRRNMDLPNNELSNYFPALVLDALNNGAEVLTLVDPKLEGQVNVEELSRACKVAGWCIQDHEKDRPTMTQVVQILEGIIDASVPPIPRFFQSLAEPSANARDIKKSEAYNTSTTLSRSFTFQIPVQPIQNIHDTNEPIW